MKEGVILIRKLAGFVKEYKLDSFLTPLFVILESVLEVLIPYKMAELVDLGIEQSNFEMVLKVGVMLLCFAVLSLLFGALSGFFAARASAGFAKNLREAIYNKIQDYSFSNVV